MENQRNPKGAGRKPGSKNVKPAQGRKATEAVTIYLTKSQKASLDTVCEFDGLTQAQVLMSGVMGLMLKGVGLPAEALEKLKGNS